MSPSPDRRAKMLNGLDVAAGTGLEIGPLNRPVVRREEGPILYADVFTTEELRGHYGSRPDIAVDDIVTVDVVLDGRPLEYLLGDRAPVDYAIASHVLEHVPDAIGWLADISSVLRPGGTLRLALPDKRFTFDVLRPLSTLGQLYESHCRRLFRPAAWQIMDHFELYRALGEKAELDPGTVWLGRFAPDELVPRYDVRKALELIRLSEEDGVYIDTHCWVLTPRRFLELFDGLIRMDLTDFVVDEVFDTQELDIEFFVTLRKQPELARDDGLATVRRALAALHSDRLERHQARRTYDLDQIVGHLSRTLEHQTRVQEKTAAGQQQTSDHLSRTLEQEVRLRERLQARIDELEAILRKAPRIQLQNLLDALGERIRRR